MTSYWLNPKKKHSLVLFLLDLSPAFDKTIPFILKAFFLWFLRHYSFLGSPSSFPGCSYSNSFTDFSFSPHSINDGFPQGPILPLQVLSLIPPPPSPPPHFQLSLMPITAWHTLGFLIADAETRTWMQVVYFGGDTRKHHQGSREMREAREGSLVNIIKQDITMCKSLVLLGNSRKWCKIHSLDWSQTRSKWIRVFIHNSWELQDKDHSQRASVL